VVGCCWFWVDVGVPYGVLYAVHSMSAKGFQVARAVAVAVILAQVVSIVSWTVAGALQPHYSLLRDGVSALGSVAARHPWIANGGLIVLGISVALAALALAQVLPRRRVAPVAYVFVVAGLGLGLLGLFHPDCELSSHVCRGRFDAGQLSWQTSANLWAGFVATVAILLTPFAISWSLWPSPVAACALAAGAFGVGVGVATEVIAISTSLVGLAARLQLVGANLWLVIVAGAILWATRGSAKDVPLTPMRAGAFFAGSWAGEGEFTPWPPLLSKLIPARFTFTRKATFLTEEMWTIDDHIAFPGGNELTQRLICELEPSGRIHVTGDLVPGGCELGLDEQGYRLPAYRYLVQLGPLNLTVRCRDRHVVEPDGTLVSTVSARWLGIPLLRMRARGQRTDLPSKSAAATNEAVPEIPVRSVR
jgi:hypothetical membrane protein